MSKREAGWVCMAGVLVVGLAGLGYAYPRLPETVASHFDLWGRPDGWMSKRAYALVQVGLWGILAAVFVPIAAWLPRVPHRMVNLPHKAYWLGPERAEATLRGLSGQLLWFADATFVFLVYGTLLTLRANLREDPSLSPWGFGIGLGLYTLFAVGWSLWFAVRYGRRPPPG